MKKKLTSMLLTVCMLLSGFSNMAVSVQGMDYYDDMDYEDMDGGTSLGAKKEADLTISSARELNEFMQKLGNGNNYKGQLIELANDITYDGITVNNYTYTSRAFEGTFDGKGHTISGILVVSDYRYLGLFGCIGESGIVKNVTIKDSEFIYDNSYQHLGGIAGESSGVINNCHSKNVKLSCDTGALGGITGSNEGIILNCSSMGELSGGIKEGGIAGYNSGYIYNSCNMGKISSVSDSYDYRGGGIVGWNTSGTIQNCYNVGKVESDSKGYSGGIAGDFEEGTIANCFCSEESSSVNFGSMKGIERNCKALLESQMKTADFVSQLNGNRGDNSGWMEWELRADSMYPLFADLIDLSECQIRLENQNFTYDGTEKTPSAVVTYNGVELTENEDYSISYQNNINSGTAQALITGEGIYQGEQIVNFEIKSAPMKEMALIAYNQFLSGGNPLSHVSGGGGNYTTDSNILFQLIDINQDGIQELLIHCDNGRGAGVLSIYSFVNEKVKYLSAHTLYTGEMIFYKNKKGTVYVSPDSSSGSYEYFNGKKMISSVYWIKGTSSKKYYKNGKKISTANFNKTKKSLTAGSKKWKFSFGNMHENTEVNRKAYLK